MWNKHFIVLTILFLKCQAEQNFQDTREERRDDSLLNTLYNPLDPTGFIFEGNKKQYIGNGVDTPRYDPDNYAFTYSGVAFGSLMNQFVPTFMKDNSINNSPNYAQSREPTSQYHSVHNASEEIVTEKNRTEETANAFSNLPVASGLVPVSKVPEFLSQTFPDNLMSTLKINASNMFPSVKFSGQPGMLGIGSQLQVQIVKPENSPIQDHQYLPLSLRNVSETHISSPTYARFGGIGGNKQQTRFEIKPDISNMSKPIYTGYPGMLGVGKMFQNIDNKDSDPKAGKNENHQTGYLHTEITSPQNITGQDYSFNGVSGQAGVNINNWKGEWPGKTSVGGDWSGDWSEKWPKNGNGVKDDKGSTDTKTSGSLTDKKSPNIDWDGSWPGSNKKESTTAKPSNGLGDFGETMASLTKLMSILSKLTTSFDNSSDKTSQRSFSQMVSGWKDEMKS